MDDLFKRVFDRVSKLSDTELREKLDGVADHPLVKVYEALSESLTFTNLLSAEDAFYKRAIERRLLSQRISYSDILRVDCLLAANDDRFLFAA